MATAKTARAARASTDAFEQVQAASSDTLKENIDRGMAALSEAGAFGKENMDAWMASANAAQKGFETLSARAVAFQKKALEDHMAAAKTLMTSKSVQEFLEKQTSYAQTAFNAYVTELNSMSDLFAGVTKDAMAPLNERMSAMGHLMQAGAAR